MKSPASVPGSYKSEPVSAGMTEGTIEQKKGGAANFNVSIAGDVQSRAATHVASQESHVRGGMLVQRWGVDLCGIRSLPPLTRDPQAIFSIHGKNNRYG
jgi:hypothetical protein